MQGIDKRLSVILIVLFLVSFFGGIKYAEFKNKDSITSETLITSSGEMKPVAEENETSSGEKYIEVYVAGEVKSPGVYRLKEGARVYQVIEEAGGPLESANLKYLHLARVLQDEETILIPSDEEISKPAAMLSEYQASTGLLSSNLININTASAREMADNLNGIGDTLAQRIVDYRNTNGSFQKIEDIKNVSGIGDKKFEDIKDDICVR